MTRKITTHTYTQPGTGQRVQVEISTDLDAIVAHIGRRLTTQTRCKFFHGAIRARVVSIEPAVKS